MSRIYLVRHGDCPGKGTYIGRGSDLSLNSTGRKATALLAENMNMQGIKPVQIITSSLKRSCESGLIIADKLGFTKPLTQDSRLDEVDFGLWEGLTYKEICQKYPRESSLWIKDNWNNSPPRGESSHKMAERIVSFYQETFLPYNDNRGDLILVGHGGSLRMLLCLFMKKNPADQWQFRLDRSGIAAIEICGDTPVLFHLG